MDAGEHCRLMKAIEAFSWALFVVCTLIHYRIGEPAPIDASTSCFHVLARLSSHHTCEVARRWIRVITLLCCEGHGPSNITMVGYGTTQSRNYRGSANGWTATKTITSTTHTPSTAWVIRTRWEWCPKAWRQVSCPFRETPIPL